MKTFEDIPASSRQNKEHKMRPLSNQYAAHLRTHHESSEKQQFV